MFTYIRNKILDKAKPSKTVCRKTFSVESVVSGFEGRLLLDFMLNNEFIMVHNLKHGRTFVAVEDTEVLDIENPGIGLRLEKSNEMLEIRPPFTVLGIATFKSKEGVVEERDAIADMYRIFSGSECKVFTVFLRPEKSEIVKLSNDIEEGISKIEVRYSSSTNIVHNKHTTSVQNDSYYRSYEKRLMGMVLDNINDILLAKFSSYRIAFIVEDGIGSERLISYIKSNFIVISEKRLDSGAMNDLRKVSALAVAAPPLSYHNASNAIGFSNRISRPVAVNSGHRVSEGDIYLGDYFDPGINNFTGKAMVNSKTLNLGTLITGLPGVGKTNAAKIMIEQSPRAGCGIAIISPTGEWNSFAERNSLKLIKIGDARFPINFFKCESSNTVKFYENLSMLISAGCNSGPYKNSMENCLLAAFSKAYLNTKNPDPQDVYGEIEEAIIEQHAVRTPGGVKYTKHGENIKSGLEGLRQILSKRQFAYGDGISVASLISSGVVFDLSEISNNMKPLIYALLLNHIYGMCDELDLNGDDKIRMMICLEEAQLIFNPDDDNVATEDLKARIQNFRKNGVALILIAHNVTDINPNIRRLCQNKFYFRQSSDVAKYASSDLIFNESEYGDIIRILKGLEQRECAINSVIVHNGKKIVAESSFARIKEYVQEIHEKNTVYAIEQQSATNIKFAGSAFLGRKFSILYLGECVRRGTVDNPEIRDFGLLENRRYVLLVYGRKKKDNMQFEIIGGTDNVIPEQAFSA